MVSTLPLYQEEGSSILCAHNGGYFGQGSLQRFVIMTYSPH